MKEISTSTADVVRLVQATVDSACKASEDHKIVDELLHTYEIMAERITTIEFNKDAVNYATGAHQLIYEILTNVIDDDDDVGLDNWIKKRAQK